MSKIHALKISSSNPLIVRCVLHFLTPAGENEPEFTWKAVAMASGLTGPDYTKILGDGGGSEGPGTTTTAELQSITDGDVIEIEDYLQLDPDSATLTADAIGQADGIILEFKKKLARELERYGQGIGTVE